MKKHAYIWIILFFVGTGLRFLDLWHPVDRESWREADLASIARNFDQESMNILQPRIDWRGQGSGIAEMEFPIYPWLIAVSYKIFGQHDIAGRILSYLFSLLSMIVFFMIARKWLENIAALIASLFFVCSPLLIQISTAIQSESLMLLFDLIAIYAFLEWIDKKLWKHFLLAAIATSAAILVKISNAYIGIFFLFVLIDKGKLKPFANIRIYLFGAIALVPPLLWYALAKGYWHTYGNSLGLSNEYHWIGLDFFTNPYFIKGLIFNDLSFALMPSGLIIILFSIFYYKIKEVTILRYSLFWMTSIYIYYIITCRTSADQWSIYYHCISAPAGALLFGFGVNSILTLKKIKPLFGLLLGSVIISAILILGSHFGLFDYGSETMPEIIVIIMCTVLLLGTYIFWKKNKALSFSKNIFGKMNLLHIIAIAFISITVFYQSIKIKNMLQVAVPSTYYECINDITRIIPHDALIIASGGIKHDFTNYPVAYNAPYFFYWLYLKGFNIPIEDQNISKVNDLKMQGAKFFIAEKSMLQQMDGFENDLRQTFTLQYQRNGILVFDLMN